MTTAYDVAQIIQISVAPVFLLAGIGAFLNVMASRLARIVDRSRELNAQQELDDYDNQEIAILGTRAKVINASISLCTFAATLNSLVIICLFVFYFTASNAPVLIASLFIATMLSVVAGLMLFQTEVFLATKWLRISIHED